MIFSLMWRSTLKLVFLIALVVVSLAGLSRALQPPMQPLSYILEHRSLYYVPQTSCPSFFENCAISSRKLLDGLYNIIYASWSPDGSFLAAHLLNRWAMFPAGCLLDNPDCTPSLLDPLVNDVRPAWGPDGSVIAFIDNTAQTITLLSRNCWDKTLQSICLEQPEALTTLLRIQQPHWSADGRYMVFRQLGASSFQLFDMTCLSAPEGCTDSAKELAVQNYAQTTWPSLSPDNRSILFNAQSSPNAPQSHMVLLDIQTGENRALTSLTGSSGYGDWSADGHYIAFVGFNDVPNHTVDLYLLDVTRGLSQRFLHIPGQTVNYPVWAPAP